MPARKIGSTELALLAAIHDAPRDDAPRLIYADWLEERGSVLCELIRWQVTAKRAVNVYVGTNTTRFAYFGRSSSVQAPSPDTAHYSLDDERLKTVILPEANKWLRPFPRECRDSKPQALFVRGMPCVYWRFRHVYDLPPLENIRRRILPHFRLQVLWLWLNHIKESGNLGAVLGHPSLARADQIAISTSEGEEVLQEFIARFADTELPDRVERLFVSVSRTSAPFGIEICGKINTALGHRMCVKVSERQ